MIGKPNHVEYSGQQQKRINLLCGLNSDFQPIAPFLTEENCCSTNFEQWFETHLLLNVAPNSVLVMDNARFHRKKVLFDLIKKYNDW